MKFSQILKEAARLPQKLYHITPLANGDSIRENGLVQGSRRSTNGIETQKKIYLTKTLESIENPFPHHELWDEKHMLVFEVDSSKLKKKLEVDPEYENGEFLMYDGDIPPNLLTDLGRYVFTSEDGRFTGKPHIGD